MVHLQSVLVCTHGCGTHVLQVFFLLMCYYKYKQNETLLPTWRRKKATEKNDYPEELAKSKPNMTLWLSKASTSNTDKQG